MHAFAELFWFTSLRPGMAMTAVLGTCEEVQLHELVNPDADKCVFHLTHMTHMTWSVTVSEYSMYPDM